MTAITSTISYFAAVGGLAIGAIGCPAGVVAEPSGDTWDIERFEDCLKKYNPASAESEEEATSMIKWCCDDSGGVWDAAKGNCLAPATEGQQSRQVPPALSDDNPGVAPPPLTPPRDDPADLPVGDPAIDPGAVPPCDPFPACTRVGGG